MTLLHDETGEDVDGNGSVDADRPLRLADESPTRHYEGEPRSLTARIGIPIFVGLGAASGTTKIAYDVLNWGQDFVEKRPDIGFFASGMFGYGLPLITTAVVAAAGIAGIWAAAKYYGRPYSSSEV